MIGCPNCGCQDYSEIGMPVRIDRNHVEQRMECNVCAEIFVLRLAADGEAVTIGELK